MMKCLIALICLLAALPAAAAPSNIKFMTLSGVQTTGSNSNTLSPAFVQVGVGTVTLKDDGSGNLDLGGGSLSALKLSSGQIFLGNVSNLAAQVTPTGDVTINNSGVTLISASAVVDSKVSASAAIARSKLASGTANYVLVNSAGGVVSEEAQLAETRGGTGISSTATFPASGTVMTEAATETVSNKTIDNSNTVTVKDTFLTLQNAATPSKQVRFDLSGLSALTTRTLNLPDVSDYVLARTSVDQGANRLQSKDLDSQSIQFVYPSDMSITAGWDLTGATTATYTKLKPTSTVNRTILLPDDTSLVGGSRTISTTAPLTGGGALTGNLTLAIPQATSLADGYLSSADWTTFNSKQAAGSYITALTSDVTAAGPGSAAATVNSVGGSTAANVHSAETAANAATSAAVVSTIVKRDGSGNFSAGTISANLTGNASGSASSFTGTLSGDVTGTQSATVVSFVGGQSAAVVSSAAVTVQAATSAAVNSTLVQRSSSGNIAVNQLTATSITGLTTPLSTAQGGTGVNGSATYPTTGTVVTEAASETLTNKTISGTTNTLQNLATEDDFSGNASQTDFTLAETMTATRFVQVFVDGRLQREGAGNSWTRTNATPGHIVFNVAPDSGSWIDVTIINQ